MVEEFVLECKWRTNWSLLFVFEEEGQEQFLSLSYFTAFYDNSRLHLRGNIKEYGTITVPVFYGMKLRVSHYVMKITRAVQEWGAEENDGPKKKTVSGG